MFITNTYYKPTVFFADWKIEHNGYYYKKIRDFLKFDKAKLACANVSGTLAYRTLMNEDARK